MTNTTKRDRNNKADQLIDSMGAEKNPLINIVRGKRFTDRVFKNIPMEIFMMIWLLHRRLGFNASEKLYLKDIARELDIPVSRASFMCRTLQDQGLVSWKHDGTGEGGTYIQFNEDAWEDTQNQIEVLDTLFHNVITAYGPDRFETFLKEFGELEEVLNEEVDKMDADVIDDIVPDTDVESDTDFEDGKEES